MQRWKARREVVQFIPSVVLVLHALAEAVLSMNLELYIGTSHDRSVFIFFSPHSKCALVYRQLWRDGKLDLTLQEVPRFPFMCLPLYMPLTLSDWSGGVGKTHQRIDVSEIILFQRLAKIKKDLVDA